MKKSSKAKSSPVPANFTSWTRAYLKRHPRHTAAQALAAYHGCHPEGLTLTVPAKSRPQTKATLEARNGELIRQNDNLKSYLTHAGAWMRRNGRKEIARGYAAALKINSSGAPVQSAPNPLDAPLQALIQAALDNGARTDDEVIVTARTALRGAQ